jgi:CubicO group peptidase (beta-lactamase class C family)
MRSGIRRKRRGCKLADYTEHATFVRSKMDDHQVPGLALAVVHDHQIVYMQGFGVTSAEAENAIPITPDTLFRAGSVTKPMTGTMLMRLVEQGALDLDRSIVDDAPYVRFSVSGAAEQVTLRRLLSHTSGLPSDLEYKDRRQIKPYQTDLEQYVREKIPHYPLVAPPGKGYFYSNPGINLAAHIAEVVTGKSYAFLMRELLFEPLKMNRTTFDLSEAMTYPFAQAHMLDAEGKAQVKRPYIDNPAEYPCGFAITSIHDLARFMLYHLNPSPVIQEMHQTQVDRLNGDGYGLTFRTSVYKGLPTVGHNGAIGKFGAVMRLFPDEKAGVALLFNRAPGFWGAAGEIANRMSDELLETRKVVSPRGESTKPTGTYLGYEVGLVEVGDSVILNGKPADDAVVRTIDERYVMVDGLLCERYQHITYKPERLSIYEGCYTADIDRWTVKVSGTQLSIYSEDDRLEVVCIPLSEHRFACDFGVIDFVVENGCAVELVSSLAYRFKRTPEAMR